MRAPPAKGPWALTVSGEASGSRLLAQIPIPIPRWGLSAEDVRRVTASGTTEALARLPRIARAFRGLLRAAEERPPTVAVLADFTEANAWLGPRLRRLGVPVFWCVAPQVWAWRPGRARRLGRAMDALGTLFAFEPPLFRTHGVDATWVGHPAAEAPVGEGPAGRGVALLPGSRPSEVRALLPPLLEATRGREATVLLAASLDGATRGGAERAAARAGRRTEIVPEGGLVAALRGFDGAVVAMGTATLECALAGVSMVAVARASRVSALLLRRMLLVEHLALPNILLGRAAVPELWQDEVTPRAIRAALDVSMDRGGSLRDELLPHLAPRDGSTFAGRTGAIVTRLLSKSAQR